MSKIAELLAKLRAAKTIERADIFAQIEKDHGKGFATSLRDTLATDDLIRGNEASIRRPKSRRRRR